jgi:flagellar hook-basal body complex protein FliE
MSQIQGISQAVSTIVDQTPGVSGSASSESGGFLDSLKSAIGKANSIQVEASQAVDALMTGQTQDLHRTMVALQQADVSFQLMMQIRNKLVAAYEEIQRMQI